MKPLADLHTHTRYSDGRGTVTDNVRAAALAGLPAVAITDHGPGGIRIGVDGPDTYLTIQEEAREAGRRYPVQVLVGAEANVTGRDGSIDLPREIISRLVLLIVGLHPYVWPDTPGEALGWLAPNQLARLSRRVREGLRNTNTKALTEAILRYPVNVVTHPDLMLPVNLDELARACARRGGQPWR